MIRIKYFVHGTTIDNEKHLASGWNDVVLSDVGVGQAKNLRNLIDINSIDLVFCSDLERAVQSSKLIFQDDKKIITDSRIRECNYGDLNGSDNSLIRYEEHINNPFSNGESLLDVEKRVREFLKFLLDNYDGLTIAIVSHKAPQLALDVIINGLSWEDAISKDWRKTKAWQPGWDYSINSDVY